MNKAKKDFAVAAFRLYGNRRKINIADCTVEELRMIDTAAETLRNIPAREADALMGVYGGLSLRGAKKNDVTYNVIKFAAAAHIAPESVWYQIRKGTEHFVMLYEKKYG